MSVPQKAFESVVYKAKSSCVINCVTKSPYVNFAWAAAKRTDFGHRHEVQGRRVCSLRTICMIIAQATNILQAMSTNLCVLNMDDLRLRARFFRIVMRQRNDLGRQALLLSIEFSDLKIGVDF